MTGTQLRFADLSPAERSGEQKRQGRNGAYKKLEKPFLPAALKVRTQGSGASKRRV